MSGNILCFGIASIPIYVILIIATISRRLTKGRANKLLILMICVAFGAALTDILGNLLTQRLPVSEVKVALATVIDYFYFLFRDGIIVVYTYYLFSVTRKWYKINAFWKQLLILVPYLVMVVFLITNPKTHAIFNITTENGYERGELIIVLYIVALIYMIFGVAFLIANREMLILSEWISLGMLYVLNAIGVLIQYLVPELQIECYFTSMTLLFVVLFVQKAERQVDIITGLPSFYAFISEMGKINTTGQKVQVIIANINNADELRRYLGDKAYFGYLHSIERIIAAYAKKEKITNEIYFEAPGAFYIICEDLDYNPVQAIPEVRETVRKKSGNIFESGARFDLKVVSIKFPEDIETVYELLHFGHNFSRFAHNKIYFHAKQIIETRAYQIEDKFDEILNKAIDNQKLKIGYEPIWSVQDEKIEYIEAVTSVEDDIYGEIDRVTLEEASRARGAGIILDEYTIEQVFAYVGAGNLANSGALFVVVHLSSALGMQKNFTERIWNLRSQYQVHPEQICFSIKEFGYDSVGEGLEDNIRKLSLQGYKLALDDYGIGYSNIKHLIEVPFCHVRLDKRMVSEMSSESGRALLSGMIQMLNNISLPAVVQGVDDWDTMEMLRGMGCNLMQGEYFKEKNSEENPNC